MRVAFTTDYYPPQLGGGVEVVVAQVARRLASAGHDVLVITLGERRWPTIEQQNGVQVRRFPSLGLSRVTGLQLTVSYAAARSMKSTIREFAADVVSAHNLYFTTTPFALRAARELRIPSVLTLHVAGMDSFGGLRGSVARAYERRMTSPLLKRADSVVAVSHAAANWARRYITDQISVIPNGVDTEMFYPPKVKATKPGIRIIFVGRLIANKGPQVAVEAFASIHRELPDAALVVVGDGPMRRRLERFVSRRGLDHKITFLGMKSEVASLLRESDIFVRPSFSEGMPLTTLEAMATGIPVIVTDVGGTAEVVTDRVNGLLVPPGSSTEVAHAMLEMGRDDAMRLDMSRAASETIRQGFTWDQAASAYERALSTLSSMHHI